MPSAESTPVPRPPLGRRIWSRLERVARAAAPSRAAWRGATLGTLILTLTVWLSVIVDATSEASVVRPVMIAAVLTLAVVLGAGLLLLVLWVFRHAPLSFRWTLVASFVLLYLSLEFLPLHGGLELALVILALTVAAVAGGAIGALISGSWREGGWLLRSLTLLCGFMGTSVAIAGGVWLLGGGPPRGDVVNAALQTKTPVASPAVIDPALPGGHKVKSLTYGAGSDAHRPEFGTGATLRTAPVDGSKLVKGWDGFTGWARGKFWGFDAKALPLNGRVWYPAGEGPFPLVLIVHGNHDAADFSDPGYEFLGRLLASRGYILVSIDENFLNTMDTDIFDGLEAENNARGWLLLEHLRVWHAWNDEPGNPFHGKVDTRHIALIGHSRGGEAVAHAAAFNRLPYNPDNANVRFDFGYNIQSLIAIAPADGQYRPAGTRTPLANVNYLTIQGSHDSDVSSFAGQQQFDRVTFQGDGDWFKSAVYVYAANHGHFNTGWGSFDAGAGLPKRIINTAALLDAAEQRRVLEVYVSAFLDCTLKGAGDYRRLFEDWRYGSAWLPKTIYLTEYADSTMKPLAGFDEDINLSSATKGTITTENLTDWREAGFPLRSKPSDNRAVILGWHRDRRPGTPTFQITWAAGRFSLSETSELAFSMADANQKPTRDDEDPKKPGGEATDEPTDDEDKREPIDLTVELIDAAGHAARLPLSHFSRLQRQLETPYFKSTLLQRGPMSEAVLQTFLFPMADFRAANAEFDPTTATTLRLVFDRTKSGVVIFDNAAWGNVH